MADEVIWATSTTGDDFQCVHVRDWESARSDVRFLLSIIDSMDEAECSLGELDPDDLGIIKQIRVEYEL